MPDIYLHHLTAERILDKLDPAINTMIDREIFRFSMIAPDIYLHYRFMFPHFRHGIPERSKTMHHTRVQEYLIELIKRSGKTEVFSHLSGVLCHYALDSTCHPWVNKHANNRGIMHAAIEHRADAIALEQQGLARKDIMKCFVRVYDIPEVREATRTVYGWDSRCLKAGYAYMKLYYLLAKDQYGIVDFLFKRSKSKFASFSYETHLCDEMDLNPLFDEVKKAEDLGVRLITAAYSYIKGTLSETELRKILGNKTYAGLPADKT